MPNRREGTAMNDAPEPTQRELEILRVLWDLREGTVREVYEELRETIPIVQNTVQAFLRVMEEKGLVEHRVAGRAFIYRATRPREQTGRHLVGRVLDCVFNGAVDQLVDSLFSHRRPTDEELKRLEALIAQAKHEGHREQDGMGKPPKRKARRAKR
jgi:predicted transcriptional regulator